MARLPTIFQAAYVLCRVSRQTVLKIEGGLDPRPSTIRKLAKALGVEPADLMAPTESAA